MDVLTAVLQAPVNTILIIAGTVILFFALFEVGKGTVRLRSGKANIAPIIVGGILIVGGLLYKSQTPSAGPTLSTKINIASETPEAPTPTIVLTNDLTLASALELTAVGTASLSVTPSETPALSLPTLKCLSNWLRVDTGGLPTPTPEATPEIVEECAPLLDLGISTISKELVFSQQGFRNVQGIFGISHRINTGYIIDLTATSNQLFNAEFWVAVSTKPIPHSIDRPLDFVSMVMIPGSQGNEVLTGTIAVYRNEEKKADKKWAEIRNTTGTRPPFIYNLSIRVTGGSVIITVNNQEVANEKGIFPNYLFLGYNKKSAAGSAIVDVRIKDLDLILVK